MVSFQSIQASNISEDTFLLLQNHMISYNKISKQNKVFGLNENKISILTKNKIKNYAKSSKFKCANLIIDSIYNEIKTK